MDNIRNLTGQNLVSGTMATPGKREAGGGSNDVAPTDQLTLLGNTQDPGLIKGPRGFTPSSDVSKAQGETEQWRDGGSRVQTSTAGMSGSIAGTVAAGTMEKVEKSRGKVKNYDIEAIADTALSQRNLSIDFPDNVMAQVAQIQMTPQVIDPSIRDMRSMLWCSIDNDDSKDLDQLSVCEKLPNGDTKIFVAIADVDSLVPKDSPIDKHAQINTTSIYTPAKVFPMLPGELSTDLTSLNPDVDRMAVVKEYVVGQDGSIKSEDVYRAQVHNYSKMAYNGVSAWLDGKGPMPEAMAKVPGMEDQVRTQFEAAKRLQEKRHEAGSLTIETGSPEIKVVDAGLLDIQPDHQNCAQQMIEDLMVTANGVTHRFLEKKGMPVIMRVVKTPKKWDRIVEVAEEKGSRLPSKPDPAALEKFLTEQKAKDPVHFPDLSLTVVKLLGRGEYVVQHPGDDAVGHFGLAVKEYAHSTAPNRRYPDLLTQRILKAAIDDKPCPYTTGKLDELAMQCTEQQKNADKGERQINKSAMAIELSDKIGQQFQAIVTGASDKGNYVRLLDPPAEGRLISGGNNVKEGQEITVTLTKLDVNQGFIDFSYGSGKGSQGAQQNHGKHGKHGRH